MERRDSSRLRRDTGGTPVVRHSINPARYARSEPALDPLLQHEVRDLAGEIAVGFLAHAEAGAAEAALFEDVAGGGVGLGGGGVEGEA